MPWQVTEEHSCLRRLGVLKPLSRPVLMCMQVGSSSYHWLWACAPVPPAEFTLMPWCSYSITAHVVSATSACHGATAAV